MSRISIVVCPEEHRKLKAIAALKGKSMKEYLLEGKLDLGPDDQEKVLVELEALLDARIDHRGGCRLKGRPSASAILQDTLERR